MSHLKTAFRIGLAIFLLPGLSLAAPPQLPLVDPGTIGLKAETLREIDVAVEQGLAEKKMPGCVVAIGRHGKLGWLKAYGQRDVEPKPVPMTVETVFDLASLTKPIATATSVMLLVEQGKVKLDDPVAKYLPEFAANGKEAITVRQLLTHIGGLVPDNGMSDYAGEPAANMRRTLATKPVAKPGEKFAYSDVGFIVLGELVQRVSGESVHQFSHKQVFAPLGLGDTTYLPGKELAARAAPTGQRNGVSMRGEVHDPRAYALGGVAGHAGLFSTANDLAVYAQMLLGRGEYKGVRVLQASTVDLMLTSQPVPKGVRTLGWDRKTGFSSQRGTKFSDTSFGHGGFTGTSLWIDPELDVFVIFLSNRLHPDGKGSVNPLCGRIATITAEAVK